jgi:hypothetical protein
VKSRQPPPLLTFRIGLLGVIRPKRPREGYASHSQAELQGVRIRLGDGRERWVFSSDAKSRTNRVAADPISASDSPITITSLPSSKGSGSEHVVGGSFFPVRVEVGDRP